MLYALFYINIGALICASGSNRCTFAPLALLSHLPGTSCQSSPSAWSSGDGLSIEPPFAGGGGVLATHEPSTDGYWIALSFPWLIVVVVVVLPPENTLRTNFKY